MAKEQQRAEAKAVETRRMLERQLDIYRQLVKTEREGDNNTGTLRYYGGHWNGFLSGLAEAHVIEWTDITVWNAKLKIWGEA